MINPNINHLCERGKKKHFRLQPISHANHHTRFWDIFFYFYFFRFPSNQPPPPPPDVSSCSSSFSQLVFFTLSWYWLKHFFFLNAKSLCVKGSWFFLFPLKKQKTKTPNWLFFLFLRWPATSVFISKIQRALLSQKVRLCIRRRQGSVIIPRARSINVQI